MALVQIEHKKDGELKILNNVTRMTFYYADQADKAFIGSELLTLLDHMPQGFDSLIVGTPWSEERYDATWHITSVNPSELDMM